MKRIIPALAFLGMIFSFTACGDDSSNSSAPSVESSVESSSSNASSSSVTSSSSVESSSSVTSSSSVNDDSSSSKSSDLVSCEYKAEWIVDGETFSLHRCTEASNTPENKKIIDEVCVPFERDGIFVAAIIGTSCPSEEKKVCESKEDGSLWYIYDEDDAKKSCEELFADDEVPDGVVSCDQNLEVTVDGETSTIHRCTEAPNTSFNKKVYDEACISVGAATFSAVGTGCPSEEKKTCDLNGTILFIYDEEDAKKSCEDMAAAYEVPDGVVSCDEMAEWTEDGETFALHRCTEAPNTSFNKKMYNETCISDEFSEAVIGTGCSGEEKKTCDLNGMILFIYDEEDAKKSCEDLAAGYKK